MRFEIEHFLGEHLLSGAFFDEVDGDQVLRFTMDGKHFEAVEDPSDGYRSELRLVREVETAPENKFPEIRVVGHLKTGGDDEIIQFLNIKNGAVVMEFGTSDTSDYYPGYVAEFHQENV